MSSLKVVTDEYGRRTKFRGNKLVFESTDSASGHKPQWVEIGIWRTEAGNYVVQRSTHYRVRHLNDRCPRADGYDLVDPTEIDTYPCPVCNKIGMLESGKGRAQMSRVAVDSYEDPRTLIASLRVDNRYSNLSRAILADLAEQDERIASLWSEVEVP